MTPLQWQSKAFHPTVMPASEVVESTAAFTDIKFGAVVGATNLKSHFSNYYVLILRVRLTRWFPVIWDN